MINAAPYPNQSSIDETILKGKKIYILDDEEYPVEIIQAYLAQQEMDIVAFHRPQDALNALTKEKPDLLLLDVMMPDMDGWAVYTKIREMDGLEELPVLFITCLSNEEVEPEMREGNLCATLSKPVIRRQLIDKISELVT